MADNGLVLRGIDWRETFRFTHIFRAFRVAIHPSKLVLALLLLLFLYGGGRFLDWVWPDRYLAVPGEIGLFHDYLVSGQDEPEFSELRMARRLELERDYAQVLQRERIITDPEEALEAARTGAELKQVEANIHKRREERLGKAAEVRDTQLTVTEREPDPQIRAREQAEAERDYALAVRRAYTDAAEELDAVETIEGRGIFITFFNYEVQQVDRIAMSVLAWEWVGDNSVLAAVRNFFMVGPVWLLEAHPVYFTIFTLYFLVIWSIFGGAIARIAAVHVAREEKISARSALRFSTGKVLSFVFAPIIPLLIIFAAGFALSLGGLLANIPWIGPIIVGAIFILALVGGFVITLVLLGTAGGFNLMYPTIAVEGSDSFDAISRSFSYAYARPWRLLFYTLVALVYGALTYLFVRLFLWLLMGLTHWFVDFGVFVDADSGAELWTTLWPSPDYWRLSYDVEYDALNAGETIGAGLLSFWNYLVISLLGAFAISFYFSANTIIYYLMRNEVDATEMDDVYLEQPEDEFVETPPVTEPAAPAAASAAPESAAPAPSAPTAEPPVVPPPEPEDRPE